MAYTAKHQNMVEWGTLSDLPGHVLCNVDSIADWTARRYAGYDGIILHGAADLRTRHEGWELHGDEWGKAVMLAPNTWLQMRLSPRVDKDTLDAAKLFKIPLACFATRVSSPLGIFHTIAVLIRPDILFRNDFLLEHTRMRSVACHGLHMLAIGFHRLHDHTLVKAHASESMCKAQLSRRYDDFACEVLIPTSRSVCCGSKARRTRRRLKKQPKDNKDVHSGVPGESFAVAGHSMFHVAAELIHPLMNDRWPPESDALVRSLFCGKVCTHYEEVSLSVYEKEVAELVAQFRSAAIGTSKDSNLRSSQKALHSAVALIDILSAENIVAMRAHPFFAPALPDYLFFPHGSALMFVFGIRIALQWKQYGLPQPSDCDLAANINLEMIWELQGHGPLPCVRNRTCAVDLVTSYVLKYAISETYMEANFAANQLRFWQRVGQRLITSHFGLGSSLPAPPHETYGLPSRYRDELTDAMNHFLTQNDMKWEGATKLAIELSPNTSMRKTEILRSIFDVESWLRDGTYRGHIVSTFTDSEEEIIAYMSRVAGDLLCTNGQRNTSRRKQVSELLVHVNYPAVKDAIRFVSNTLLRPEWHITHHMSAQLVCPSQTSKCCECDGVTHVLEAMLLSRTDSMCPVCHAARCPRCIAKTGLAMAAACRRCGATPKEVSEMAAAAVATAAVRMAEMVGAE